ncbi:hypothetical protein HY989_06220 [Candidatus Micrarchaeota archaeon]|nr:hypothetical protein [Candidatus Micrarchaeota archaeon]
MPSEQIIKNADLHEQVKSYISAHNNEHAPIDPLRELIKQHGLIANKNSKIYHHAKELEGRIHQHDLKVERNGDLRLIFKK